MLQPESLISNDVLAIVRTPWSPVPAGFDVVGMTPGVCGVRVVDTVNVGVGVCVLVGVFVAVAVGAATVILIDAEGDSLNGVASPYSTMYPSIFVLVLNVS